MKATRTILLALAVSLVGGKVIAQQDQPARSYQQPIFQLDDVWLKPLSAPPIGREPEFKLGSIVKVTSPSLAFLLAPQRALEMPSRVTPQRALIERIMPPPTFNDFSTRRAGVVILRLSW